MATKRGKDMESTQLPKKRKGMDWCQVYRRHIALRIIYLGWPYRGLASQANLEDTVEHHLFKALTKVCLVPSREEAGYSRSGRTDKGVSATGQVVAVFARCKAKRGLGVLRKGMTLPGRVRAVGDEGGARRDGLDRELGQEEAVELHIENELDYVQMLNRVLPDTIRVSAWAAVPLDFSARFSTRVREYRYFFERGTLDVEAMAQAAKDFEGTHDFRNFCKMDMNVSNFERRVLHASIESVDERMMQFNVVGLAFLWHQIRCMMAVLKMVGRKEESPDIVVRLLDTSVVTTKPQYLLADEIPLVLKECKYDDMLQWQCSQAAQQRLREHFGAIEAKLLLQCTVVGEALASVGGESIITPPKHIRLLERDRELSYEERRKRWDRKKV